MNSRPTLLITLGDVAGVGPEIVVKAWPHLVALSRPVVVGDTGCLRRTADFLDARVDVRACANLATAEPATDLIPCVPGSDQVLTRVRPGEVSGAAGRAAYDFLCRAIDLTMHGEADGIVTAPLHKEGLRAAGLEYPGHTEILADRTGSGEYGMMLWVDGLAVLHVTLHMALRDVFRHLFAPAVLEKIRLADELLARMLGRRPRLAVTALNPHASDGGMFGDEEATIIEPAVKQGQAAGITVTGPLPSDTLFVRARRGEFDGVVAMYHDQGHIALKLIGELRAVNISVGLPIIRTSVAHGTAYDIAGRGVADPTSLIEAVRVAARLAAAGRVMPPPADETHPEG